MLKYIKYFISPLTMIQNEKSGITLLQKYNY